LELPKPREALARKEPPPAQECVDALIMVLEAGADPNASERESGQTPLIHAAEQNAVEAIRVLVTWGAQLDARDARGRTALMHAAWNGHPTAVQALLACGANYKLLSNAGNTALTAASLDGTPDRMLSRLDSMEQQATLDPRAEQVIEGLESLKDKLGTHGAAIPDAQQFRQYRSNLSEAMREAIQRDAEIRRLNCQKVIKILKGAGATV
jgi:hypothetical protein